MTRSKILHAASLATALASLLLASSCAMPTNGGAITADPDRNHPITVRPTFKDLKLSFATPASGLTPEAEARFIGFVQDYLARGNGSISISVPKGPGANAAIRYFGERMAHMGVPRSHILVATRELSHGDPRVVLGFITYKASTAPCGNWTANVANTASNLPVSNFGCANQHNLAAMVADPRDLLRLRKLGSGDATRRSTVIHNYEDGKPTAATKTGDQSVNVSGVQ